MKKKKEALVIISFNFKISEVWWIPLGSQIWACLTLTKLLWDRMFCLGAPECMRDLKKLHSYSAEERPGIYPVALTHNFFTEAQNLKSFKSRVSELNVTKRYFKLLTWQEPLTIPIAWPCAPSLVYLRICRWSLPKSALTGLHSYTGFPWSEFFVRNSVPQHQRHPEEMENKLPSISETFSKNTWTSAKKHHQRWEGR